MIVIGADTHKGSHTLAAVDEGTGRVRGSREIKADDAGASRRGALGARAGRGAGVGDRGLPARVRRLEQALIAPGERVVRVPPHRMGASRQGSASRASRTRSTRSRSPARSVKDGVERFPVAYLDEQAMEIRLLADHRHDLVAERTRT